MQVCINRKLSFAIARLKPFRKSFFSEVGQRANSDGEDFGKLMPSLLRMFVVYACLWSACVVGSHCYLVVAFPYCERLCEISV